MKKKLICAMSLTSLIGCSNTFLEEIEEQGYTAFDPPRAGAKVGGVFAFEKNSSGKVTVRELCHNLYKEHELQVKSRAMTFPARSMTDTVDASIAASLVRDIVSTPPKLDAGFSNVRNVEIEFHGVKSNYITEQSMYDPSGQSLPLAPSCYAALKRYADNDQLSRTFLIFDVVNVDGMNYSVSSNLASEAGAEFDIKKVVELKPNISFKAIDKYTLKIDENRSIGYKAFSIKSFKPNGLVGPAAAKIEFEPLTRKELVLLEKSL
ncbi:hypothetical protein [Vibrio campbellii]|uniref:hypothetical protein n=1 Tax=Vibrio campbellii TaxID=680 RepID=UPI0015C43B9F|nr:hypothetical protein [Vibrio campbellii]